jgi:hypothetical protein
MAPVVPPWLNTVRALRPTHAVAALAKNPDLLLLNPRDLRRAVPGPLARSVVPLGAMLPGLLRAARDASALVGLVKPGSRQGEGPTPFVFAANVFRVAEETMLSIPFFMATSPLELSADDASGERLKAEVQRYLDAGFTEVVVRADGREVAKAGFALRVGLEVAREREVSVVLASQSDETALPLHASMERAGVRPDMLSLEQPVPLDRLPRLLDLIRPVGVELPGPPVLDAGLRGVDFSSSLMALAQQALSGKWSPERYRDLETEITARERLEALTYADAWGLLQAPALRGAAVRAMHSLAESPGY